MVTVGLLYGLCVSMRVLWPKI